MKRNLKGPSRYLQKQSKEKSDKGLRFYSRPVNGAGVISFTGLPEIYKPDTCVVQKVFTFRSSNIYQIKSIAMKKILLFVCLLVAGFGTMAVAGNIDEKLVHTFREIYPDAVQVNWLEYPETYAVNFEQGKVKETIIFKKDGTFIKSTRYYMKEYLPYHLVAAIQEKYPEKKIFSVTEISSPYNIDYFIKLEDAKTWMTVKLDAEGNIKVLEKFRKAL
jgi:hypothetical protein